MSELKKIQLDGYKGDWYWAESADEKIKELESRIASLEEREKEMKSLLIEAANVLNHGTSVENVELDKKITDFLTDKVKA